MRQMKKTCSHRLIPALTLLFAGAPTLAAPPLATTDITAPPSYAPTLVQTGGHNARVPMKHASSVFNGNEILTHSLATSHGNRDIPFKISMRCRPGSTISHLAYKIPGQSKKILIDSVTNAKAYSKILTLRPFSNKDFESACRKAMGGNWHSQQPHPLKKVVLTQLTRKIQVWGQCSSGIGKKIARSYTARVKLRCDDRDWAPPVPAIPQLNRLR